MSFITRIKGSGLSIEPCSTTHLIDKVSDCLLSYPVFVYGRVESSRVENSVAHGYKYI